MNIYAKIALKLLRNKKTRKALIVAVIISLTLMMIMPVANGLAAAVAIKTFITSVIDFFSEDDLNIKFDEVNEDILLKAFEEGYTLTPGEEAGLRMKQDDFIHLLERASEYNHAGERKREISVEYEIKTYSGGNDEDGGSVDIDYDWQDVSIDNSHYEGLYKLDYRLLYYYCILSVVEKQEADEILDSIVPLDKDFKPITQFNDTGADDVSFISSERIDKIYTYVTTNYDYSFDALRDEKSSYSMSEAMSVPHTIVKWSDGDSDCTMHLPQSYLRNGSSAYSYISNDLNGQILTATKEIFSYDSLVRYARSLYPRLSDIEIDSFFEFLGASDLLDTFKNYGNDKVVGEKNDLSIYAMTNTGSASFTGLNLSATAKQNLEYIFNKMLSWGFSAEMAAGACGNLQQENNFQTTLTGSAVGLVQWMGGRKTGLYNFAESEGKNPADLELQVDYMKKELTQSYLAGIDRVLSSWCNASSSTVTDIDDATDAWCKVMEGCICNVKGHTCRGQCASTKDGKSYQELLLRRKYAHEIYTAMTLISIDSESTLSSTDRDAIMNALPLTLSADRKKLIEYALNSVGRIPYYFGDKTNTPGYENQNFGYTASQSDGYYSINAAKRRYKHGLDCSGWIHWVYLSALGKNVPSSTGTLMNTTKINKSDLKPGDILVKSGQGTGHVVMYLGTNSDGTAMVVHESAGRANNVCVSMRHNALNLSAYHARRLID